MAKKKTTNPQTLLLVWDCLGLEYSCNLTDYEKDLMWSELKGEKPTVRIPGIDLLILRARANPQRNYEIYTVQVEPDVSLKDIQQMFKDTPQEIVDLVRARGHKIYSDRLYKEDRVIQ
jgi:hypothetical protein